MAPTGGRSTPGPRKIDLPLRDRMAGTLRRLEHADGSELPA